MESISRTKKSIWVAKLQYFTTHFKTHADSVIREKLKQEKQTPQQIAKEVLNEILSPTAPAKKLTRKQKIEEQAKQLSLKRAINTLKKSSKKKGTGS